MSSLFLSTSVTFTCTTSNGITFCHYFINISDIHMYHDTHVITFSNSSKVPLLLSSIGRIQRILIRYFILFNRRSPDPTYWHASCCKHIHHMPSLLLFSCPYSHLIYIWGIVFARGISLQATLPSDSDNAEKCINYIADCSLKYPV